MPRPTPTFLHRIRPAASSALLVFLVVFATTYFAVLVAPNQRHDHSGYLQLVLPNWAGPISMAMFCALAVGIPIVLFTWYAEGRESRIEEMLDKK
jgi:hypothetical protein